MAIIGEKTSIEIEKERYESDWNQQQARKNGNTAILINRAYEELNKEGIKTEMIQFTGLFR